MSATIELFERFKNRLQVGSDHAAGQILGVKPQTVSNWRTRGSQAEPKLIESMCQKLQEDPVPWLLRAQADQAHDPDNVLVWKRLANRLGVALGALVLFLGRSPEAIAQTRPSLAGLNEFAWNAMDAANQVLNLVPFGAL